MKKATRNILLVMLLLGLTGAAIGYYLWNKPHQNIAKAEAAYALTAPELFAEYEQNESAANEKYLGKILEVSGTIIDVKPNETGNLSLTLEGDGMMFGVICNLDEHSDGHRTDFQEGEEVTLKGICTGMLMDVVLSRCVESNSN